MPSPLPEIREEDAPLEIKRIYADMRMCMHLPLVNLIYRYFATVPGVLPHAWSWVRDMVLSGSLDAALTRLKRNLPLPEIQPFEASTFGLSEGERLSIKRVLAAYNRGNGLNLFALSAIRIDLHRRAHASLSIAATGSDNKTASTPRLLKFSELTPDVADLVATTARLHDATSGVIPSLYLHLANWPEFLSVVCARIAPLLKDGSIERARQAAVEMAEVEAKALVAPTQSAATVAGFPDDVIATLNKFTTRVIPEMLSVGLVLDRAWPVQAPTRTG